MRWRRRSATECVTASATRRSRKHLARRSLKPSALSAAPSSTTPPFEVNAPPSKAPTSLRPPEVPKASSSWLHCVGIGEYLLASRSRCGTTTFAESEPRCSSRPGEIQGSRLLGMRVGPLLLLADHLGQAFPLAPSLSRFHGLDALFRIDVEERLALAALFQHRDAVPELARSLSVHPLSKWWAPTPSSPARCSPSRWRLSVDRR